MKKTLSTATTVAAVAAISLGVVSGTAGANTRTGIHNRPSGHTIEGKLLETSSTEFNWSSGYVSLDKDFDPAGHRIGSDVTTCRASAPSATSASCDAALAFKQGIVEISFTEKQGSSNINGLVTGGSGIYDHARGTVSITEGSNSDGPSTAIWTLRLIY